MTINQLQAEYHQHCETSLFSRYINLDHLKGLLEKHSAHFEVLVLGKSVLGEDIHFVKVGTGEKRILMWSQMHGNESTTTKAVFDLLNILAESTNENVYKLLDGCTIGIIPMLNPDGSRVFSRLNANQIDLNRDAQNLSQPESRILRKCFEDFKPDYCFNLHGQRTIFSAGSTDKSATISFLSPAQDVKRSVTKTRKRAMDIIVKMNQNLQNQIPGQVGIYDDTFNINCVGDTFQAMNVPTVLFEAGHFYNDYHREKARELMFQSLWVGIVEVALGGELNNSETEYFEIPNNQKLFYDIIIRKAKLAIEGVYQVLDIAVQYEERLDGNRIVFIPKVEKISDLNGFFGHREINADEQLVFFGDIKVLYEGSEIDFVLINGQKHSLFV